MVAVADWGNSRYTFTNDLNAKRIVEIIQICNASAEISKELRYHFLTDRVCDCLDMFNYFNVVHPDCRQCKSTRL